MNKDVFDDENEERLDAEESEFFDRNTMRKMHKSVFKFREKWLQKVEEEAHSFLFMETINVDMRRVFLVESGTKWLDEFGRKIYRLSIEAWKLHEALAVNKGKKGLDKSLWMPELVRNCSGLKLHTSGATSSRKISRDQARAFARKAGVRLPKSGAEYRLRTSTGNRYRLSVTVVNDAGSSLSYAVPFVPWIVVECVHPYVAEHYSLEPLEAKTRAEKYSPAQLVATVGNSQLYLLDTAVPVEEDDDEGSDEDFNF